MYWILARLTRCPRPLLMVWVVRSCTSLKDRIPTERISGARSILVIFWRINFNLDQKFEIILDQATVIVFIWNNFQKSWSTNLGRHIIFILFSCILRYRWRANVWQIRKSLCQTASKWRRSCLGRTPSNRERESWNVFCGKQLINGQIPNKKGNTDK